MEKECEHVWESMGGTERVNYTWTDSSGCYYEEPKKTSSTVVFAVFCPKCGEIKQKEI